MERNSAQDNSQFEARGYKQAKSDMVRLGHPRANAKLIVSILKGGPSKAYWKGYQRYLDEQEQLKEKGAE